MIIPCLRLKDRIVSQLTNKKLMLAYEVPKQLYVFILTCEGVLDCVIEDNSDPDHAKCIALVLMFLNRQFIDKMCFDRSSSVMQDLVLMLMQRQPLQKTKR